MLCIIGGAFMVVSYGLEFGRDKTYQWMVAMISAFFVSILITQPIKVTKTKKLLFFEMQLFREKIYRVF